jgi:hypothetical protein
LGFVYGFGVELKARVLFEEMPLPEYKRSIFSCETEVYIFIQAQAQLAQQNRAGVECQSLQSPV